MRRRRLLTGLGGLAGAGGLVGTGAFSSVSARRDVTVAVADDDAALLKLTPSGTANGVFAEQLDSGVLALDFDETDAGGTGLGTDSVYDFDDVFRVTNQGTQPVYVWGTFGGASGNFTPSGSGTDIWLYPNGNSGTKLRDDSDSVIRLDVGETVNIGVHVDTHDVTSDQELTMTIHADAERPSGTPGTTRPYPPINVSKAGEPTRYFHTIPTAAEYASGGDGVEINIEDGTYPRDDPAFRITDPNNSRNWIEYALSDDDDVTFTGEANSGYYITIERDEDNRTDDPWLATVQDPDSSENQDTTDFGLTLGLSGLIDSVSTTADGNAIIFDDGSESIEYTDASGDAAFVFSRENKESETLSFTQLANGSIEIMLTTDEGSVSFTEGEILANAPTLLNIDPQELELTVPDSLTINGRSGRPIIKHTLEIKPTVGQRQLSVRGVTFEAVTDDDSILVTPDQTNTIRDVSLINVRFTRPGGPGGAFGSGGVTFTPGTTDTTVEGLTVRGSQFNNHFIGLQTTTDYRTGSSVLLKQVDIQGSSFTNNNYGLWVGDIEEGYVKGSVFETNSVNGILSDKLESVGFENVEMNGNGVAVEFSDGIADYTGSLADSIESGLDDDKKGVTGIVNSEFANNSTVVERFSVGSGIPVSGCTFSDNDDRGDIIQV